MFSENTNIAAVSVLDERDDVPCEMRPTVYHRQQYSANGKSGIDLPLYLCDGYGSKGSDSK